MARIAGSIVLAVMLARGQQDWSLALFIVLAATDNIDGLLARRQGTTRSGAFLDPLADKILVGAASIALGIQDEVSWLVVVLIISREIAVSAFRMFAARRGASVPASWFGKIKTLITLVAIGLVLVPDDAVQDVGPRRALDRGRGDLGVGDRLLHARRTAHAGRAARSTMTDVSEGETQPPAAVRAEIVTVGTELLLGQIVPDSEQLMDRGAARIDRRGRPLRHEGRRQPRPHGRGVPARAPAVPTRSSSPAASVRRKTTSPARRSPR